METRILMYNNKSAGGRAIRNALNIKHAETIRNEEYKLINWGASSVFTLPRLPAKILNVRSSVDVAKNKLMTFQKLLINNINIPEFTTDINIARDWCEDNVVICRRLLEGSHGRGIKVAYSADELIPARLYTKLVENHKEYRVHVFKGKIIGASRKIAMDENANRLIRNHGNGWRFSLCDHNRLHSSIKSEAIAAVAAINLDFGAVDLIWTNGVATILEINTAPGIEGSILEAYITNFREWMNDSLIQTFRIKYLEYVPKEVQVDATTREDAIGHFLEVINTCSENTIKIMEVLQ